MASLHREAFLFWINNHSGSELNRRGGQLAHGSPSRGSMRGSLLLLVCVAFLSGCASAITHTTSLASLEQSYQTKEHRLSHAYSGVCTNFEAIINHTHSDSQDEALAFIAFYDLPFSFALDTILLPVDLTINLFRYSREDYYPQLLCSVI